MPKSSRVVPRSKKLLIVFAIGILIAASGLVLLLQNKQLPRVSLPDLPVNLPRFTPEDVTLSKAEEIPHSWSPYHRYTYTGANREIVIVEQLGGWNYNPREKCMYMVATKGKSGETAIDPDITCMSIGVVPTDDKQEAEVFKVTINGPVDSRDIIPDYYIAYSVHRFAIKVTKGTLTDQEVKAMAIDFDSHNFKELENSLAHQ